MGMYNALIAAAKTIVTDPTSQSSFACVNKLRAYRDLQGDPAVPAAFAGADDQHEIAIATGADGGTFTLTLYLAGLAPFTTGAIDFNDNAAAIEAIIDAAATTAEVPDYVAGDIAVSGGDIATAEIVLDFSGESVASNYHGLTVVNSSLTDSAVPVAAPAVTREANGQPDRNGYAILAAIGVITMAEPPEFSTAPTVVAGPNHLNVAPWFVQAIAEEIAWQEGNAVIATTLVDALVPQQR